ncbi:5'-nucleotidase, C-terminal domain-containing protein [Toxoplasma gondii p89]|uniref:5'-nucleotidase, C-terminal domain-containing protein n=1 Tax=Toxoplasma gondii p89 TaxID=943119 RepID=A0A086JHB8_TOXGO|nr:5'-nucleotidase, C-terminal domain-containing protein [Toxoplasma gondii p89]
MPLASTESAAPPESDRIWRECGNSGNGVRLFGSAREGGGAHEAVEVDLGKVSPLSTKDSSYQSLVGKGVAASDGDDTRAKESGCGVRTGNGEREVSADQPSDTQEPVKLRIVHFNDVYNVFSISGGLGGGAAPFCTGLREKRGPDGLVLFSGDIFSPSPLSEASKGRQMAELLNYLDVHTSCYGNHDLDFGWEWLELLAGTTKCKWVMSNARSKIGGGVLANAQRYRIFEWGTTQRVVVGIMALIEEDWIDTLNAPDQEEIVYQDFVEAGREMVALFRRRGCDLVIALTHMRWNNDEKLAREVDGIDLILGGHDHSYVTKLVNGTAVIKSGSDFREFSAITLTPKLHLREQGTSHATGFSADHDSLAADGKNGYPVAFSGSTGGVAEVDGLCRQHGDSSHAVKRAGVCECLGRTQPVRQTKPEVVEGIHTEETQPAKLWSSGRWWLSCEKVCVSADRFEADDSVMEMLVRYQTTYGNSQGCVLGAFPVLLETRFCEVRTRECNSGNWLADLMREYYGVDVALYNSGGIRSDCVFAEGEVVTSETLHAILSGTRQLDVIGVPGNLFKSILETSVSRWPQLEGRFLQVSGLRFVFEGSARVGERVLADEIQFRNRETGDWEPLVPDRVYSVATATFLARGGDGLSVLVDCPPLDTPQRNIRDLSELARLWFCRQHRKCGFEDVEEIPPRECEWIDRVHMRDENYPEWRIRRI